MAFNLRQNKCCCCSLKTGVYIYAVLYTFMALAYVLFGAFQTIEATKNDAHATNPSMNRGFNLSVGIIGVLKGAILVFGIIRANSKAVLAFLVVDGFAVVVATIGVIIITCMMPVFAILFIYIAIEAAILLYVYSYYRELEDGPNTGTNKV